MASTIATAQNDTIPKTNQKKETISYLLDTAPTVDGISGADLWTLGHGNLYVAKRIIKREHKSSNSR